MPRSRPPAADPTFDALYRSVCAAPCDDLPRLVLADYLDERGRGDDRDRASAIRLQVRLAGVNEWDDGYTETLLDADRVIRRNLKAWTADVPGWEAVRHKRYRQSPECDGFTGGYPGSLGVGVDDRLPAEFDRLTALPVTDIGVDDTPVRESDPTWARWVVEQFPGARAHVRTGRPATVRALAATPRPPWLTGLSVGVETDDEAVPGLVFPPVAELRLALGTPDAVVALAARPRPAGLEHLHLSARLTAEAAGRLAAAGWVDGLRRLDLVSESDSAVWRGRRRVELLTGPGRDESDLGPVLRAGGLAGLRTLTVLADGGARVVDAVADARDLGPLDEFSLYLRYPGGALPDAAVQALVRAPALAGVKKLSLQQLADPDAGLAALGDLPALRVLTLAAAGATRAGLAALARSPAAGALRRLELGVLDLTFAAAAGLTAGPGWPELAELLFPNGVADADGDAVAALVDSPKFPRLTSLDVSGTSGAADLWRRLAASDAVARFRRLRLAFPIDDAELNALLDSPAVRQVGHLALPGRQGITPKTRARFVRTFGVALRWDR